MEFEEIENSSIEKPKLPPFPYNKKYKTAICKEWVNYREC